MTGFQRHREITHVFAVTADVYQGFMGVFGDKNPLHTNVDFARDKGFESVVMHGNILNGFLSYFIGECLPSKDVIIHSQHINYRKPVYLNDELLLKARVEESFESVNVVSFSFKFLRSEERVANGAFQIGII